MGITVLLYNLLKITIQKTLSNSVLPLYFWPAMKSKNEEPLWERMKELH